MQKRTMIYSVALVALVGGALGSAAVADQMRMQGGMMFGGAPDFATLDADKDGKVTAEEFAAARKARIEGFDADKNGKISADELVAMQMRGFEAQAKMRADRMISMLDADGDGALAAAELLDMPGPGMAQMMTRLDTDGDGAISAAEFDARGQGGEMRGHGKGHGKGHDRGMLGEDCGEGMGQGMGQGMGMGPDDDACMGPGGQGMGDGMGQGMGQGMGKGMGKGMGQGGTGN